MSFDFDSELRRLILAGAPANNNSQPVNINVTLTLAPTPKGAQSNDH